jgi:hypothetical protein
MQVVEVSTEAPSLFEQSRDLGRGLRVANEAQAFRWSRAGRAFETCCRDDVIIASCANALNRRRAKSGAGWPH